MDSMELERERGITIQSAATYLKWGDNHVNIIDTPGHVDFTVEVERALRVLDGAILVLCAVSGVQSQSITVDRQMRRYNVPRLAFINKCDRTGADPIKVCDQLREKLRLNSIMFQLPIGLENDHLGVVDLIQMKAMYFEGDNGEVVRIAEIPAEMQEEAEHRREILLDAVSMFSDDLMEAMLADEVTEELIIEATRNGVISLDLCPVFCGSAYKNKGVQPLMDAVNSFLPCPTDVENIALNPENEEEQYPVTNNNGKLIPSKPVRNPTPIDGIQVRLMTSSIPGPV
jgi:elongation factor G